MKAAREFNLTPNEWDALTVAEKERFIACLRDDYAMQQISLMSEDKLAGLGGVLGWVRV